MTSIGIFFSPLLPGKGLSEGEPQTKRKSSDSRELSTSMDPDTRDLFGRIFGTGHREGPVGRSEDQGRDES